MADSKTNNSSYDIDLPPYTRMSIKRSKHKSNKPISKIVILSVILMATITVIAAAIFSLTYDPEEITKSQIDQLAADYYEQYFYERLSNSEAFKSLEDVETAMDKYVRTGFSRVSLRQMILHNQNATKPLADQILRYCDQETTYIVFYPEPPFERTSYHTDITYSCAF